MLATFSNYPNEKFGCYFCMGKTTNALEKVVNAFMKARKKKPFSFSTSKTTTS
jgi:hypothetical protein